MVWARDNEWLFFLNRDHLHQKYVRIAWHVTSNFDNNQQKLSQSRCYKAANFLPGAGIQCLLTFTTLRYLSGMPCNRLRLKKGVK